MRSPVVSRDRIALVAVAAICALVAAATFDLYGDVAYERFKHPLHDRSRHYLYGLWLALDIRHLDILQLALDLEYAQTWPPLFGIAEAAALLALGFDVRSADVVSLISWVATALVAFLLARRLSVRGGNYAGCVAALFVLSSPAHRIYSMDTMLESLGALLTISASYAYVRSVQAPTAQNLRVLGLLLTLLLLEKYNYWVIAILGLAAAELARAPGQWRRRAESCFARLPRGWLRTLARDPWAWSALGAAATAVAVAATGGTQFELLGRRISMRSAAGPVQVAYWLVLLRIILVWRKGAPQWWRRLDDRYRTLLRWHALPLVLLLSLPKRVFKLFHYVSPANTPMEWIGPTESLRFYWHVVAHDYHVGPWSALVAIALAGSTGLAFSGSERWKCAKGLLGPLALVAVASSMIILHPHHQSRFVHSWLPNLWSLAGVGAGLLFFGGRATSASSAWLRNGLAGVALAGLIGIQLTDIVLATSMHRAKREGPIALEVPSELLSQPSIVKFADAYLPELASADRTAFLATIYMRSFVEWTFLERYPDRSAFAGFYEPDPVGSTTDEQRAHLDRWLAEARADTLVLIDVDPAAFVAEPRRDHYRSIPDLLRSLARFRPIGRHVIDEPRAVVTIWRLGAAGEDPSERV